MTEGAGGGAAGRLGGRRSRVGYMAETAPAAHRAEVAGEAESAVLVVSEGVVGSFADSTGAVVEVLDVLVVVEEVVGSLAVLCLKAVVGSLAVPCLEAAVDHCADLY